MQAGRYVMSLSRGLLLAVAVGVLAAPVSAGAQSLDYGFFKANIEPIFLKKREGHTRCIVCHAGPKNASRLRPWRRNPPTLPKDKSRPNSRTSRGTVFAGNRMEGLSLLHRRHQDFGG